MTNPVNLASFEPLARSSGVVGAAVAAAAIPAVVGKQAYITGFEVTASGSTAALPVDVTVTGIAGGTLTYTFSFPAGVLVGATPLIVEYPQPIPASALNTAITVSCPSGGAGNTKSTVNIHGFYAEP